MLGVVVRRLLLSIPLLLIVSLITFVLQSLIPGDAARTIVGLGGTQDAYERVRRELGLNLPLWQQYLHYLGKAVHGDLGTSLFTGQSVAETILQRLPVTLSVIVGATVLAAIIGVALGCIAGRYGGVLGRSIDVLSLVGLALPNFWLGLILIAAFAVAIPLFPATGYVPFSDDPGLWIASILLPVVALAVGGIAQVAKITRDGVSDALQQDYIRTLRASGVPERSLLWKHSLKNAGIPVITVIGLGFVGALSASLFVENVFVLPGLGTLVSVATDNHDVPIIQGVALAYTVIVIIVNLVIDVSYAFLNPKVRTR
jgi:peptide/nickel transport system permease protein